MRISSSAAGTVQSFVRLQPRFALIENFLSEFMSTKRVLAVHDLCSFGRCSLTAAIPVISALGSQVCPFPTAWFSNNLTYGDFHFTDFTPQMTGFMDQWEKLGFHYDALYSGFLADASQVSVVLEAIRRFGGSDALIVVDPVMGDDGAMYPIFTPAFVDEMRRLVGKATLITPNYTEACLLLGRPLAKPTEDAIPDASDLKGMCRELSELGAGQVVITSVPAAEGLIKVVDYDARTGLYEERLTERIALTTCGTGDLFTSVMTAALLRGFDLSQATRLAMEFTSFVIDYTHRSGSDVREGVQIEPCLGRLIEMAAAQPAA